MTTQEIEGSLPADEVASLTTKLRAGPLKARLDALEALATIGGPQAAEVIADTALCEGDLQLRARAAQALSDLRDPRATAALLAVLEAGWDIAWMSATGEPIRQVTARLAEVHDEAVADRLLELMRVRRGQRGPWAEVCKVLGANRDPRAVSELLWVVGGTGPLSATDKVAAIEAIQAIGHVDAEVAAELGFASGKNVLPRLDPGAFPDSIEVQATNALLDFIARAEDPQDIEVLEEVLSSAGNPYVRGEAAAALARFPDHPRVVTVLEQAARTERDLNALHGIARGLEEIGSEAAAEVAHGWEKREVRNRVGFGVLTVIAGLLGLAAALTGGYFFMLGGSEGLKVALIIWVVAAGPLLGGAAKNVVWVQQARTDPHFERDDGYCAACHQSWPCASERV